jgi:hypothetical protein
MLEELEGKLHTRAPALHRVRPPARSQADDHQVPHQRAKEASDLAASETMAQASSPPTEPRRVAMPRAKPVTPEPAGAGLADAPSQDTRSGAAPVQVARTRPASRQRLRAQQAAQPHETFDPNQGFTPEVEPKPAITSASAIPLAPPSSTQASFEPLSAGEMAYLMKRLAARQMTIAQARAAAGLTPGDRLEDVARRDFAALKGAVV